MTEEERDRMCRTRHTLHAWGRALKAIRRMERENADLIDLLASVCDTLQAQRMTGMPHGSGVGDPVGRTVEQLDERRAKYQAILDANNEKIEARRHDYQSTDEKLKTWLTELQLEIVTMKYQEGRSMEQIAEKLNYSLSGVQKQEHKAVLKLSRRIG